MYAEDYARETVYADNVWHGNASTPAGGYNGPCTPTSIQLGDWTINSPSLIPTCIGAALIGIICGLKIKRSNAPSSSAYSKSFFMFACMMTDAMIFHCFLHNGMGSIYDEIAGIVDVGLTSSIGLSFGFNALFDMGVLQPGIKSSLLMFGSYATIIIAWIYAFANGTRHSFVILYVGVVAVSCGLYCIITLIRVIKSKGLGFKWLLFGALSGGIGLASVYFPSWLRFWCVVFTPWFGAEFWWFALSDVSMYCLYRYYMTSHVTATTPSYTKSYASDSEDESDDDVSHEEVQIFIQPRTRVARQPVLAQQQPQQQQQQVVYIPLPSYYTTPTQAYYAPQVAPAYYY